MSHIPFQTSIFVRFFEQEQRIQAGGDSQVGVMPLGGFIPGEDPFHLVEAQGSQVAISKVPILFTGEDAKFLSQFPPQYWRQALAWRYGEGLLKTKSLMEKGKEIDHEEHAITFKHRNTEDTFKVNTFGMEDLVQKLEKPRNIEAFYDLKPNSDEDWDKYEATGGGLYGYDLSGHVRDKKSGQSFTRGYVPMTLNTSGKIISRWTSATASGWLGDPPKSADLRNISFGGGAPRHKFMLDWRNRPIVPTGSRIPLPVRSKEEILKFYSSNPPGHMRFASDVDGLTGWRFERRGSNGRLTLEKKWGFMPIVNNGWLVESAPYRRYLELVNQIEKVGYTSGKADEYLSEILELRKNAEIYSEFDYNVHEFNPQYPKLHTNKITMGGFNPNKQQREVLPADQEIKEKLQKHFLYAGQDGNQNYYVIDNEGRKVGSPYVRAILKRLGDSSKSNATTRYLLSEIDMVIQEGIPYILNLAGHTSVTMNINKLDSTQEGDEAYRKIAKFVTLKGMGWASMVAQFDHGHGTRRRRRKVISIDDKTATGNEVVDLIQDYTNTSDFRGVDGDYIGQRSELRRGTGEYVVGLLTPHDLSMIRNKVKELSQTVKQETQQSINAIEKQKAEIANDNRASEEKIKKVLAMRDAMLERYLDLFWLNAIANKNMQMTNKDAIAWAEKQIEAAFAEQGIKLGYVPPLSSTTSKNSLNQLAAVARQGVEIGSIEAPEFTTAKKILMPMIASGNVEKMAEQLRNNEKIRQYAMQYLKTVPDDPKNAEDAEFVKLALQMSQPKQVTVSKGLGGMLNRVRKPQPTQPQPQPQQQPPQQQPPQQQPPQQQPPQQ